MAVYDDIRTALEQHLDNTSSIPAIAWENVKFNPSTGTPFIKVRLIHSARVSAGVGFSTATGKPNQQRYQGVLQLLVHYPENAGPGTAESTVNTLIDRFEAAQDLSYNSIFVTVERSERMGAYTDSPWYVTPINISWHCYST